MLIFLNTILFAMLIWASYNIIKFAHAVWMNRKRFAAFAFSLIAVIVVVIPIFTLI